MCFPQVCDRLASIDCFYVLVETESCHIALVSLELSVAQAVLDISFFYPFTWLEMLF